MYIVYCILDASEALEMDDIARRELLLLLFLSEFRSDR